MQKIKAVRALFLLLNLILALTTFGNSQTKADSGWSTPEVPFRVLNVASNGSSIWVCGPDESIAVSVDGGQHWKLKHQTSNGELLLNIQFSGEKFGYAAGTGGLLLTSEDAGETWIAHPAINAAILQVSFADPQHGLIRTPESLLFTTDGGAHWSAISVGENAETLSKFPYTFSLVVLDAKHMAVMLKQGSAQYEPQAFLISTDAGVSWQTVHVPNSTLYSFLANHGEYWAIGTEVIHKDQPGGGYAVPVAWHSPDGMQWSRSTNDLSACKMEMCVACTRDGCLSSNGTITNVFSEKPSYRAFPPNPELTPKWGATDTAMCFIGNTFQCARITDATSYTTGGSPIPAALSPVPLGTKVMSGPHCIACEMDHFLVDQKVQGFFTVKLTVEVAINGTVTGVEVKDAPSPEIKSRIEQQARQWIFEPYVKDGQRVNLKLNTKVAVNVMRSR